MSNGTQRDAAPGRLPSCYIASEQDAPLFIRGVRPADANAAESSHRANRPDASTQAVFEFADQPFPQRRTAKLPKTPVYDALKAIKQAERAREVKRAT